MSHRPNRMSRISTALAVVLVASSLAVGAIPSFVGNAGAVERVTRSDGAGRVETAVAVAADHWDRADTVLLASAGDFPDALAATPLAAALDAPLLLTPTEFLPDDVARTIMDLDADEVIVLGGTNAVSTAVEAALQGLATAPTVRRIAAADRFSTAAGIAHEAGAPEGIAVVASGEGFADALAAGTLAATPARPPVLLAIDRAVPAPTLDALADLDVDTVLLVGGTSVLSDAVAAQLTSAGYDVDRISGADRFATTAAVLDRASDLGLETRTLIAAAAGNFPDALAAGPLAAHVDGALLLATPDSIPPPIPDIARRLGAASGVVVGGQAALSSDIVTHLASLLGLPVDGHLTLDGSELVIDDPITFDYDYGAGKQGLVYVLRGATDGDHVSAAAYGAEIRRTSDDRRYRPRLTFIDRDGKRIRGSRDGISVVSADEKTAMLRNCPCSIQVAPARDADDTYRATFRLLASSTVHIPGGPVDDDHPVWRAETTRFSQRAFVEVELTAGDFVGFSYAQDGAFSAVPEVAAAEPRTTTFQAIQPDGDSANTDRFGTGAHFEEGTVHGYAPADGRYRVRLHAAPLAYGPTRVAFNRGHLEDTTIGGPAVTLPIDRPGRPVGVRFDGTADQRLELVFDADVTDAQRMRCRLTAMITEAHSGTCRLDAQGRSTNVLNLRSSGPHELYVMPDGLGTGTVSIQVRQAGD